MNNETAKIILEQLGGNKVLAMTGATAYSDKDSLILKMSGSKYLTIRLDIGKDLYEVSYISRRFTSKKLQTIERELGKATDVYCDQLKDVCEKMTGLYFSL